MAAAGRGQGSDRRRRPARPSAPELTRETGRSRMTRYLSPAVLGAILLARFYAEGDLKFRFGSTPPGYAAEAKIEQPPARNDMQPAAIRPTGYHRSHRPYRQGASPFRPAILRSESRCPVPHQPDAAEDNGPGIGPESRPAASQAAPGCRPRKLAAGQPNASQRASWLV
jgi:hypothetical protein